MLTSICYCNYLVSYNDEVLAYNLYMLYILYIFKCDCGQVVVVVFSSTNLDNDFGFFRVMKLPGILGNVGGSIDVSARTWNSARRVIWGITQPVKMKMSPYELINVNEWLVYLRLYTYIVWICDSLGFFNWFVNIDCFKGNR